MNLTIHIVLLFCVHHSSRVLFASPGGEQCEVARLSVPGFLQLALVRRHPLRFLLELNFLQRRR